MKTLNTLLILVILLVKINCTIIHTKTIIQEKDNFILDGISKFIVNENEDFAYIINGSNSFVMKINLKDGLIDNTFKSNVALSDSASYSIHSPYPHRMQKWKFLNFQNLKNEYDIDPIKNSNIINYLDNLFIIENRIIVPCLLYVYKYSLENNKNTSIEPRHGYLILDSNLILQNVKLFEIKDLNFTREILNFNNGIFYINIKNEISFHDSTRIDYQHYGTLATYDTLGYYKNTILHLDSFYIENAYNYNLTFKPIIAFENDQLWYTYPFASSICNLTTNKKIDIIPNLYKVEDLSKLKENYIKNNKIDYNLLNLEIEQLIHKSNILIVVVRNNYNNYRELKYYDITSNNLIKNFEIESNDLVLLTTNVNKDKLYLVYYDKINEYYYYEILEF